MRSLLWQERVWQAGILFLDRVLGLPQALRLEVAAGASGKILNSFIWATLHCLSHTAAHSRAVNREQEPLFSGASTAGVWPSDRWCVAGYAVRLGTAAE